MESEHFIALRKILSVNTRFQDFYGNFCCANNTIKYGLCTGPKLYMYDEVTLFKLSPEILLHMSQDQAKSHTAAVTHTIIFVHSVQFLSFPMYELTAD